MKISIKQLRNLIQEDARVLSFPTKENKPTPEAIKSKILAAINNFAISNDQFIGDFSQEIHDLDLSNEIKHELSEIALGQRDAYRKMISVETSLQNILKKIS
jgi:hypothetical protein